MFDALVQQLIDNHNKEVGEYNEMCTEVEKLAHQNADLQAHVQTMVKNADKQHALIEKQQTIIEKAVEVKKKADAELMQLRALVKELQALDPRRLAKVNAELKKKNAQLKDDLAKSEAGRKQAVKDVNNIATKTSQNGSAPFYHDPVTGNTVGFVPGTFVSEDNDYGAQPNTPVLLFFHQKRGITRQGVMMKEGHIAWCDARNSTPTEMETSIARNELLNLCKQRKISLPKHIR